MGKAKKSSFLDRVLGRIGRLDTKGLQTVVERLARERSFLETLFDTIEDGVLVLDENGKILYFNRAVTTLLGLKEDFSEGQQADRFLPELDWKKIFAFTMEGGQRVYRQELEISYPRPRYIRFYAAPLDESGSGSSGVALILHDATEARQKTFEAIESERIQALTLLAASVAHEIGNPLNALHIHSQLMERELKKLSASFSNLEKSAQNASGNMQETLAELEASQEICGKLQKYLTVAKGEIGRLDYIVTQFLQAIRPTQPKMQKVSLNDVATETLDLLKPELENRGLEIQHQLDPQLPVTPMDPAQVKQVLVNLIKNAMHAMTRGGSLSVETGKSSEGVWISVADTGGGISQEKINRIFEPFFTTKKKGSGLGLMIVQRIIREHGGRIEVESRVGRGTRFRVWLPWHERPPMLLESGREPDKDLPTTGETPPSETTGSGTDS